MKVDELPAGPRLDVLVAEKVMGFEAEFAHQGVYVFRDDRRSDETSEEYEARSLWQPSADIKAAWEVVKKVMEMPDDLSWDFARNVEWACHVRTFWDNDSVSHHILDEITPGIICRAALKAVDVTEVPDES